MSREIVIDSENLRYVVEAVANYRTGRDRIEATVLTMADHIRNGRRHSLDSLMSGSMSTCRANDIMFEELVTQVLVAAQIVQDQKMDIKYQMIAEARCEAYKKATEAFERDKDNLVRDSRKAWLEFQEWKQTQEKKAKQKKGGAK